MTVLINRLFEVHDLLADAAVPHAFGGAIALAYFTAHPRADLKPAVRHSVAVGRVAGMGADDLMTVRLNSMLA